MNTVKLGRVQTAVLKLLRADQLERSEVYLELRKSLYKERRKSQSRQAIKRAIKTLKQRQLITEHYGILSLHN